MIHYARLSALSLLMTNACGGSGAVPDGVDASSDATACTCPAAESLVPERIVRNPGTVAAITGTAMRCPEGSTLLAGSCARDGLEPEMALYTAGFWDSSGEDLWGCEWRNASFQATSLTDTAVCLQAATAPPPSPDGCDCLPPQPIEERIVRIEQAGNVAPNATATVSSRCDAGALLIGGSCAVEHPVPYDESNLYSVGFAPDDSWQCAWRNPSANLLTASAMAICVQPPAPGTAPEAPVDWVVRKEQRTDLPAMNVYLQDVTCDVGDFLLWGSCTLDNPTPALGEISLFRAGFLDPAQDRPNTWQCAWNNPTDQTPAAIATAVCIKPPATP